jgi:predicted metalloprotease with PDZ domain
MQGNRLSKITFIVLGSVFALGIAFRPAPPRHLDLTYTVTVRPSSDFEVTLRVRGLTARHPRFRFLQGWGVLQGQDRHIEDLAVLDEEGRPVSAVRDDHDGIAIWELSRRPEETVLRYRVRSYDPELSAESSFADARHFVLLGYSLFLMPQELRQFEPATIRVDLRSPEGWPVWSSWPGGEGSYAPATAHDLWSGMLTGGDHHVSELRSGTVSVSVLTERRLPDVMGLTIANRLLPVLKEMHGLFGAPPRGDSLRVLALYRTQPIRDGMSLMSGNSEEGAFLCLATSDRFRNTDQMTVLAAHECLHFYLGGAVTACPEPPFRNTPDLIWFMEGVTEYLSYRLMERAGLLSADDLATIAVRKEEEYRATRGWQGLTLADAARRMEDVKVYSLVYSRGFLVGFLLDQEMTRKSGPGAFDRALRTLFEEHNFYRDGRVVTAEEVRKVFDAESPGAGRLIARFAESSETIPRLRVETASLSPGSP